MVLKREECLKAGWTRVLEFWLTRRTKLTPHFTPRLRDEESPARGEVWLCILSRGWSTSDNSPIFPAPSDPAARPLTPDRPSIPLLNPVSSPSTKEGPTQRKHWDTVDSQRRKSRFHPSIHWIGPGTPPLDPGRACVPSIFFLNRLLRGPSLSALNSRFVLLPHLSPIPHSQPLPPFPL